MIGQFTVTASMRMPMVPDMCQQARPIDLQSTFARQLSCCVELLCVVQTPNSNSPPQSHAKLHWKSQPRVAARNQTHAVTTSSPRVSSAEVPSLLAHNQIKPRPEHQLECPHVKRSIITNVCDNEPPEQPPDGSNANQRPARAHTPPARVHHPTNLRREALGRNGTHGLTVAIEEGCSETGGWTDHPVGILRSSCEREHQQTLHHNNNTNNTGASFVSILTSNEKPHHVNTIPSSSSNGRQGTAAALHCPLASSAR